MLSTAGALAILAICISAGGALTWGTIQRGICDLLLKGSIPSVGGKLEHGMAMAHHLFKLLDIRFASCGPAADGSSMGIKVSWQRQSELWPINCRTAGGSVVKDQRGKDSLRLHADCDFPGFELFDRSQTEEAAEFSAEACRFFLNQELRSFLSSSASLQMQYKLMLDVLSLRVVSCSMKQPSGLEVTFTPTKTDTGCTMSFTVQGDLAFTFACDPLHRIDSGKQKTEL